MLNKEIIDQLKQCAYKIDEIISREDVKNLNATIKEITEFLRKEINWFAKEAPRIAKERNYNLPPYSGQRLPKGYAERNIDAHGFELWRIEEGKEDKKVGQFDYEIHPKLLLRAICEFEEKGKGE